MFGLVIWHFGYFGGASWCLGLIRGGISVNFEFSGEIFLFREVFLGLVIWNLVFAVCLNLELVFCLFGFWVVCGDFAVLC